MYNWTFNSNPITNNSSTLIIDPATNANSGTYGVSVTVDGCTSDVATIDITVNDAAGSSGGGMIDLNCVNTGTSSR